jgi:hypothetical protein
MNRKNFLLSLPLLGGAIKAVAEAKPEVVDPLNHLPTGDSGRVLTVSGDGVPEWVREYELVKTKDSGDYSQSFFEKDDVYGNT